MATSTTAAPTPAHILDKQWLTDQNWSSYREEQHRTWQLLWEKRMVKLRSTASARILEGIEAIGLDQNAIPDLDSVNERLGPTTGWNAFGVTGFIPASKFFRCLSHRLFPTTVTIRPVDKLDYLPEPDIFHDVFGHVPLHSNPVFADFLAEFGLVAASTETEEETAWLTRLFWFTVEFGLIKENGETRVYGSGLVSSSGDAENALGSNCDRRPFDLEEVITQPFEIDHFQDVLFVIDDFEQLFEAVSEMKERLG